MTRTRATGYGSSVAVTGTGASVLEGPGEPFGSNFSWLQWAEASHLGGKNLKRVKKNLNPKIQNPRPFKLTPKLYTLTPNPIFHFRIKLYIF
jgi:hypothetical protein